MFSIKKPVSQMMKRYLIDCARYHASVADLAASVPFKGDEMDFLFDENAQARLVLENWRRVSDSAYFKFKVEDKGYDEMVHWICQREAKGDHVMIHASRQLCTSGKHPEKGVFVGAVSFHYLAKDRDGNIVASKYLCTHEFDDVFTNKDYIAVWKRRGLSEQELKDVVAENRKRISA